MPPWATTLRAKAQHLAALLVLGLAVAPATQAQLRQVPPAATPVQPGWVTDKRTGCRAWNENPKPGGSIQWSGGCTSDMASGSGTLEFRWPEAGQPRVHRYVGTMRDGRMNGRGVHTSDRGDRYEGEFHDGSQHGRGVFTWRDGTGYEGEYRDRRPIGYGGHYSVTGGWNRGTWIGGCFRSADSRATSIGRPLAECP